MNERTPVNFSDLPDRVQTVARWTVEKLVTTGTWPSQADVARHCHKLGIEGRELRDPYNHDLFDGTLGYPPRPDSKVRVRPWALRDLGVLGEAFDRALTVFRDAVRQIAQGEIDSVAIRAADVSADRSAARDLIGHILVDRLGGDPPSDKNDGDWSALVGLAELDRQPATADELLRRPDKPSVYRELLPAQGVRPFISRAGAGAQDRYKIGKKLGSGGYADVWRAVDSTLRRPVAIKFVRRSAPYADTAVVHARTVAQVGPHPNVVTVFDVVEMPDPATDEPAEAIVMELLEGPTLEARIRGAAFSRAELIAVGSDLMSGVAEYHRRKMAHFDLHGGNVILAAPNAKLVDPLFHDTAILGRTGALDGQQNRDLRDLRHLLGSMLRHSEVPLEAVGQFERVTGANVVTLEILRREYVRATDESVSSASRADARPEREPPSGSESSPTVLGPVDAAQTINAAPGDVVQLPHDRAAAALEAIRGARPSQDVEAKRFVQVLAEELDRFEPSGPDGDPAENLIKAIETSRFIVDDFGRVAREAAAYRSQEAVHGLVQGMEHLLARYQHRQLPGSYRDSDFDLFKVIGHELGAVLAGHLITTERWPLMASLFSEQIHHHGTGGRPRSVGINRLSQHSLLLVELSRQEQRKSIHADILKERHETVPPTGGIAFDDFIAADLMLFLGTYDPAKEFSRWYPRSAAYLESRVPRFLSATNTLAGSKNLAVALQKKDPSTMKAHVTGGLSFLSRALRQEGIWLDWSFDPDEIVTD